MQLMLSDCSFQRRNIVCEVVVLFIVVTDGCALCLKCVRRVLIRAFIFECYCYSYKCYYKLLLYNRDQS
uniref:Uncharacterized protein n=1 Tax=Anguilla anguilla TaxID=7936 RepID=A0A0E9XJN5_ANGAN